MLVTGLATLQGLSRWTSGEHQHDRDRGERDRGGHALGAQAPDRLRLAPAAARVSAREAIEGSEAKEESGERRSRVTWRRTDSSSWSERATSARPKRSKAALLARRWPAEKP